METITVVLKFKHRIERVHIDSIDRLHDIDVYQMLEAAFPLHIKVNYDNTFDVRGYSYTFERDLLAVLINRNN